MCVLVGIEIGRGESGVICGRVSDGDATVLRYINDTVTCHVKFESVLSLKCYCMKSLDEIRVHCVLRAVPVTRFENSTRTHIFFPRQLRRSQRRASPNDHAVGSFFERLYNFLFTVAASASAKLPRIRILVTSNAPLNPARYRLFYLFVRPRISILEGNNFPT
jgi:hypothetical protein